MTERQAQVVTAADRFRTERGGVVTTHEFSFGDHYSPDRIRFGPLVAHNVETLAPGSGYEPHAHRDVEIVTWVVDGALEHDDDHGHRATIGAGMVQRLTAASGVTHSELNADRGPGGAASRFVQLWLDCPAELLAAGEGPSYQAATVDPDRLRRHMVALGAGPSTGVTAPAIPLRSPGVTLLAAEVPAGETRSLPNTELLHVHVIDGAVHLRTGERLAAGDSIAITGPRAEHVVADATSRLLALAIDHSVRD